MSSDDCILAIKVVPNASKTEISGWLGDLIKIRLQATPEAGKANKALIKFLSQKVKCDRKQIVLESGEFSPQKRIRIVGKKRSDLLTQLGIEENHG